MVIDVLQLADLHFERKWFSWLEEQVKLFDLVVISGDLLCERSQAVTPLSVQAAWVVEWSKRLKPKGWVAISSGNHDHNNETISFMSTEALGFLSKDVSWFAGAERDGTARVLSAAHWMDLMDRDQLLLDGRQGVLHFGDESLIVTVSPDHFYADQKEISNVEAMWKEGRKLAQKNNAMWLVSQHVPYFECPQVSGWSLLYEPQVVCAGHVHQVPGDWEANFIHRLGKASHFHPGQIFPASDRPSCVRMQLDLETKRVLEAKRY